MPWSQVFLVFAALILADAAAPAADPRAGARRVHGAAARAWAPIVGRAVRDPSLHPDLPRLLLLRLPARLHHRALPRLRHRGLLADPGERRAGEPRHHHDLGARRGGHRGDRARQHRRHAGRRRARAALPEEVPAGADLPRAAPSSPAAFILAPMTPASVLALLGADGVALARHRAADLGPRRADLGRALHGHALRHRLLLATSSAASSASGSAGGSTTSTAPTRWSGGSASASAPSRRWSTCRSANARPPCRPELSARPRSPPRPGCRRTRRSSCCRAGRRARLAPSAGRGCRSRPSRRSAAR